MDTFEEEEELQQEYESNPREEPPQHSASEPEGEKQSMTDVGQDTYTHTTMLEDFGSDFDGELDGEFNMPSPQYYQPERELDDLDEEALSETRRGYSKVERKQPESQEPSESADDADVYPGLDEGIVEFEVHHHEELADLAATKERIQDPLYYRDFKELDSSERLDIANNLFQRLRDFVGILETQLRARDFMVVGYLYTILDI
jgi:hypothetical protein